MTLKHYHRALGLGLLLALVSAGSNSVFAQSTIFNIPSTDVVAKKKTYFEFDFISHLEGHKDGGFQTYVPRVVYGLGKGVEVGLNIGATDSIAPTTVYAQPNIKWQFYANEDKGVATTIGAIAFTPRVVPLDLAPWVGRVGAPPRVPSGGQGDTSRGPDVSVRTAGRPLPHWRRVL